MGWGTTSEKYILGLPVFVCRGDDGLETGTNSCTGLDETEWLFSSLKSSRNNF